MPRRRAAIGLRLLKVGMPWPLEPDGIRAFLRGSGRGPGRRRAARDHREPDQAAAVQLARRRASAHRRQVRRARHALSCRSIRELTVGAVGAAHRRPHAAARAVDPALNGADRGASSTWLERAAARANAMRRRSCACRSYCSGCPHNTSTRVPEGSRALAGIGCHYMVAVDGPQHRDLHADGRRRRALDRHLALHRTRSTSSSISATAPISTRGILAIRQAVAAERQHHLQDALQRRRGDDRRPAGRWLADRPQLMRSSSPARASSTIYLLTRRVRTPTGAADLPPGVDRCSHRDAHRPRDGEAARDARLLGHRLRPDLRGRETPRAASAAWCRIRPSASSSTRRSAKAAAIARCRATACRSSRWRPSSAASAQINQSSLQQGLFPASRASARPSSRSGRHAAGKRRGGRAAGRRHPAAGCPRSPAWTRPCNIAITGVGGTGVLTIGAHPRHGRASRRQGARWCSTWLASRKRAAR